MKAERTAIIVGFGHTIRRETLFISLRSLRPLRLMGFFQWTLASVPKGIAPTDIHADSTAEITAIQLLSLPSRMVIPVRLFQHNNDPVQSKKASSEFPNSAKNRTINSWNSPNVINRVDHL